MPTTRKMKSALATINPNTFLNKVAEKPNLKATKQTRTAISITKVEAVNQAVQDSLSQGESGLNAAANSSAISKPSLELQTSDSSSQRSDDSASILLSILNSQNRQQQILEALMAEATTIKHAVRMVEAINNQQADDKLICAYTFDAGPNAVVYYGQIVATAPRSSRKGLHKSPVTIP